MTDTIVVPVLAEYQLMSDMTGEEYGEACLGDAKAEGVIEDYTLHTSVPGVWGLQLIVFTALVRLPRGIQWPAAKDHTTDLLNLVMQDSDVEVRWLGQPKEG